MAIAARHELAIELGRRGLAGEPDPSQARWVEAVVGGIRFVSVYVPNGRAVGTDTFKEKLEFLDAMSVRAAEIDDPAVIAGDMNVCPTDLDVWEPSDVHGSTHVTPDERIRLAALAEAGFVDSFRRLRPEEPGYSWWDYRAGHFHKGFGLRIDLVFVSGGLAAGLRQAEVVRDYRKPSKVPGTKPSDHAPVMIDLD